MKKTTAFDHQLLAKMLFPDVSGRVIICENNSLEDNELANAVGVIAFGKRPALPNWNCLRFDYVNNPDGSLRWLYPSGLRSPLFLKLYNGSGWRGFLFKNAFKMAFSLGLKKLAKSGTLHVFYKKQLPLAALVGPCHGSEYAIFTGTVGENRKAVVFLKNESGEWFYKLPLTASAAALVQNEGSSLKKLASLHLTKISIPKAVCAEPGVLLSNVQPTEPVNSFELQSIHFEAIVELSEQTLRHERLCNTAFWQDINACLMELSRQPIVNSLPHDKINHLINLLHNLRDSLYTEQPVATVLAHGDFTPWNMFVGRDRLHVYDWELSERLPLLFDAFHFLFQSGVLVKRQTFDELEATVFSLMKNEKIQRLLKASAGHFQMLLQLYLLRNISYYLLRYVRQATLHIQAHWLLKIWEEALVHVGVHANMETNHA